MCYDVSYNLQKAIRYIKVRGGDSEYLRRLEEKYKQLNPYQYHVNGFSHDVLPVITNQDPDKIQLFEWGLIPAWAKDRSFQLSTLNARSEDMFDKPSFRYSASHQKCLILLNGFFEYHHAKGRSIPFYIYQPDEQLMVMAGLWSEWHDIDTDTIRKTLTIVTCRANRLLGIIHNNPKLKEARMPVILPDEQSRERWLNTTSKEEALDVCKPYEQNLQYHTVLPLKGKYSVGNTEMAIAPYQYPGFELSINES